MGIDVNVARFLLSAHERKVNFEKVLTIGEQEFFSSPGELRKVMDRYGITTPQAPKDCKFLENTKDFFKILGAKEVVSLDISKYEGATLVHDLNTPIDDQWRAQFSVVFDGGSLEHIFNFPAALKNCMAMVKEGGHLIIITPANNFMGHGFYQFSPELFFSALSTKNGFQIERIIASEMPGRWYEVVDPQVIQQRVQLCNDLPVYLFVLAKKTNTVEPFREYPQQSDYAMLWSLENEGMLQSKPRFMQRLKRRLKKNLIVRRIVRNFRAKIMRDYPSGLSTFSNRKFYKPVDR